MNQSEKSALQFEEVFSSKGRSRIIKILAKYGELNISKIVKKAQLNHNNVERHLDALSTTGLIQEKNFGRIRVFRYKNENLLAKAVKELISFWDEWNE